MRRVVFDEKGEPEVLRVEDIELPLPPAGQITVDIDLIGLNRFETQFRRDSYAVRPVLPHSGIGAEGVGIVRAVGPGANGFKTGDRVTVLPRSPCVGTGMYADAANVPVENVVRSLDGSPDAEEAAFWCSYLTAFELLSSSHPLPEGSHILITAAASSVGLALLQMTGERGLKSIATTRSADKVEQLKALGADHVITTDLESIADGVARITGGAGVPIAADALAGRFTPDVVAATAAGGAIKIYGALSEPSMVGTRVELPMFALYQKVIGFTSFYSVTGNPKRFGEAQAYLRDGYARGAFRPHTDRTFTLADIVAAHHYLEKGGQIGKILVKP